MKTLSQQSWVHDKEKINQGGLLLVLAKLGGEHRNYIHAQPRRLFWQSGAPYLPFTLRQFSNTGQIDPTELLICWDSKEWYRTKNSKIPTQRGFILAKPSVLFILQWTFHTWKYHWPHSEGEASRSTKRIHDFFYEKMSVMPEGLEDSWKLLLLIDLIWKRELWNIKNN